MKSSHTWFFILSDCPKTLPAVTFKNMKFEYQLNILNSDGSEFSGDEQGLVWFNIIFSIVYTVAIIINFMKTRDYYRKEEEVDWAMVMLIAAMAFELFNFLSELFHQYLYAYNGYGNAFFNFNSTCNAVMSRTMITILLLLFSWGWCIDWKDLGEDIDLYIPMAILVFTIHIMVVALSRITTDDHNNHHDYDGITGIILIIIRFGFFIYFAYGVFETYYRVKSSQGKSFVKGLFMLGSIWFLAFPFWVLWTYIFVEPMNKHRMMVFCMSFT